MTVTFLNGLIMRCLLMKGLMEYLQRMEERRHDDNDKVQKMIERKCNEHYAKLRREFGLGQNNGRMFRATSLVIILLLVFYFCGYSGPRGTNLMLN